MQILVNVDNHIEGRDRLIRHVEEGLETALSRFADRITRVEVHLGDESAGRPNGAEMRCMLEARPAGHAPVAVTDHAGTLEEAFRGATHKLQHLLDNEFGRLEAKHGKASIRHEEPAQFGIDQPGSDLTAQSGID